jgi:thiamine phosphate synthase YjbQ (UPF0047 family)
MGVPTQLWLQACDYTDPFDLEYLQHDLLDIMRKMIPDFTKEHQYHHPGPVHARFARYYGKVGDFTSMNTDGHLRSAFFGRSETMTIKDGKLDGGEFAHVYFIDWDHVRARQRQLNVNVMGTAEDVVSANGTTARSSIRYANTLMKKKHIQDNLAVVQL